MPSAKAISQVQTDSRTDNQFQQNFIQGVSPLLTSPLAINNIVSAQTVISGSNTVNHGLDQTPSGMIPFSQSVSMNIYGVSYGSKTVTFTSSAAGTCSFLFF